MTSTEVMRLTKDCLLALRLRGHTISTSNGEKLEAKSSDVLKVVEDPPEEGASNQPDEDPINERTRRILATLKALLDFLPLRGTPKDTYSSKGGKIVKNEIEASPELLRHRREFSARGGYSAVLNHIIDSFDTPWFDTLNKKQRKRFIDPFFLEGIPSCVLLVFCERLKSLPQGIRLSRVLAMLEKFFTSDSFRNIFFQHAVGHHEAIEPHVLLGFSDKVLSALTAFPHIAANKLKEQTPKYLSLKSYYTFVVLQLTLAISEIMLEKEYSQQPLPTSVPVFLGTVVGRLCFASGDYGDQVLVQLLSSNGMTCLDHRDWKDLFNNIFLSVPDTCLEATLLPLLRHSAHPVGVQCILGADFLTKKAKAVFLLTNKFLFHRHFSNPLILQNIMGYLSSVTIKQPALRQSVFIKTVSRLFDVWGTENYLKHTSLDQHAYLTKALLCAMACLTPEDIRQNGDVFLSKLLSGMSCHLSSSTLMIRELGMILAENTVDILRTEAQITRADTFSDKLEFEHAATEEVEQLIKEAKRLSKPPEMPSVKIGDKILPTGIFPKWDSKSGSSISINDLSSSELAEALNKLEIDGTTPSTEKIGDEVKVSNNNHIERVEDGESKKVEELDSDDDLEPFISNEPVYDKSVRSKAPKYLQECMLGLLKGQDANDPNSKTLFVCLENCESLIRGAQAETMEEVGVEMARILLHLADRLGVHNYNFEELRLNALIALVVKAPKKVASYLTCEFYERNYSIRQRMDILEVLSNGAQELSNPDAPSNLWFPGDEGSKANGEAALSAGANELEHWSTIVKKRIDAKTKIISKGRTKPSPTPVPNRFGSVAGSFFFPLLKMLDRPSASLDLLDKDHLLLGRLLYTLGVLLYSAVNTSVCRNMAASLLEVVWCIRYHSQTYVRVSLIYALSIVVISLPPAILVADFQAELLDTKAWLEEVAARDPEPECQRQAQQTLTLLLTALSQGWQKN